MVNAQLLWKQLNTLYIISDLLWILFYLRVHSSQYSHPLTRKSYLFCDKLGYVVLLFRDELGHVILCDRYLLCNKLGDVRSR
jgi:hypothetical protein